MMKIEVGDGWAAIVLNIIVVGSAYPESWNFRFHRAWRNSGRMRVHVTTDSADMDAVIATAALNDIAWQRSGTACEICGRSAELRLGQKYALTLCRDHEHLVGERHQDDGRIRDPWAAHVAGSYRMPVDYGDPEAMKEALLWMWSRGQATTYDVMQILRMSRTEIMSATYGQGLHLDDESAAAPSRQLSPVTDDGTRH